MKMVLAIVNNDDSAKVSSNLIKHGYSATKLATTGGFLMSGNTTFLIGVDDEKVDNVVEIISEFSSKRKQAYPVISNQMPDIEATYPIEIATGGAIVFVMNVERFEKL